MALTRGRANALNLLGMRKLNRMPPNFSKMILRDQVNTKLIDLWIYQNLDQRYCLRKTTGIDDQNKMVTRYEVGFEEPKELTMFSLGCPHLHK
jgi:hypothetical protein